MGLLLIFVLVLVVPCVLARCKVIVENSTVEYVDHRYLDYTSGIAKINQENTLHLMLKLKIDLPENIKISGKAFKWFLDDYRIPITKMEKNLKDFLEMEMFGLQSLWVHNARPPFVWPLQKGVIYRSEGWIPDGNELPPTFPEGKVKVQITVEFANKTKLLLYYFYGTIEYK